MTEILDTSLEKKSTKKKALLSQGYCLLRHLSQDPCFTFFPNESLNMLQLFSAQHHAAPRPSPVQSWQGGSAGSNILGRGPGQPQTLKKSKKKYQKHYECVFLCVESSSEIWKRIYIYIYIYYCVRNDVVTLQSCE